MKSPIDIFFKLGDKVTKGDPMRKMNYDYAMMWIIFLAFFSICIGNLYEFFFVSQKVANLGWAAFGLAIMWFQYYSLKGIRAMRITMKTQGKPVELKIEPVKDMLEEFKK